MDADVDVTHVWIETERLIIRPWRIEDLENFNEYAKVDGVGQMAGWNPHASIEESRKILTSFIQGKIELAIVFRENQKAIGSIGLEKLSLLLSAPYDTYFGREIGYALSRDYWGRGIMPEAVKGLIRYCFDQEHYNFLLICHAVVNHQSQRVIEKCGFHPILEKDRTSINGQVRLSRYYILDNK